MATENAYIRWLPIAGNGQVHTCGSLLGREPKVCKVRALPRNGGKWVLATGNREVRRGRAKAAITIEDECYALEPGHS